jgi:hypothetical protein
MLELIGVVSLAIVVLKLIEMGGYYLLNKYGIWKNCDDPFCDDCRQDTED